MSAMMMLVLKIAGAMFATSLWVIGSIAFADFVFEKTGSKFLTAIAIAAGFSGMVGVGIAAAITWRLP